MRVRVIQAVDLFCGAGGTSTGLFRACHSIGRRVDLLAINHWRVAIETHSANHPGARHICARLDAIRPEDAVKSGYLDILVASPECTHHSVARGGRPVCDQLRASAWLLLRWLETLRVENVLVENVQEFRNWGPIGTNGRPLKRRRGETYQAFLSALRSFGYTVEDRVLNAADYGDPTTRKRLFILARRGNKRITWPEATHGDSDMFSNRQPYRTAREIIDWSIKGQSIYDRKRPLAENTMRRIMAGIRKFGGESFIVHMRGTKDSQINGSAKSIDHPIPAVTASGGGHFNLCEPFLIHTNHAGGDRVHDIDRPVPTITCGHRGEMGLCEPFLVQYHNGADAERRTYPLDKPIPTLDTQNRYALCEPFVIGQQSCAAPRSVDEPLPTIATAGAISLVEPFIVQYNGKSESHSVDEPLNTVTTKERFGLVEVSGRYQVDIRFRMLQPHELAAAMSFEDYKFSGNRGDQVRQIGNAVPVRIAEALCKSLLDIRRG
jgi:DNA (cytosine-5)-methyltransferase 1